MTGARVLAAGALTGPNGARAGEVRHVRTLGRLGEGQVAGLLDAAACFVSPARYEPFGLGVLEAAQRGRALVLADIPTFRELWDGAALFADAADAPALAGAMGRVLGDEALRADLGARARERAGRYTLEAMVDGTLAAYRELLGR